MKRKPQIFLVLCRPKAKWAATLSMPYVFVEARSAAEAIRIGEAIISTQPSGLAFANEYQRAFVMPVVAGGKGFL